MQHFVLHCGCIWRLFLALWLHISLVAAYEWRFCLALRLHMNKDSVLPCGCVWVLHCGCIYGWKRSLALWLKTQSYIVATYEWKPTIALWVDRSLTLGVCMNQNSKCVTWLIHQKYAGTLQESWFIHTPQDSEPRLITRLGLVKCLHTSGEWVMSHIWMSHVTHMNESCHTHERVMPHIWMSHPTYERA